MTHSAMPFQHWIIRPDGQEFPLHTYPWVREIITTELGIPRLTGNDDIILERGSLEHGSRAVMVKLPETRLWSMLLKIQSRPILGLEHQIEDILFQIFNPLYWANGSFEVPTPLIYKRVSPGNRTYMIKFFLESGLENALRDMVDNTYRDLELNMTSPEVTLYGADVVLDDDDLGNVVYDHADAFGNLYFRWQTTFTYDGTWVTCPRITVLNDTFVISRIGWKNLDTGVSNFISYYNWRENEGWPAFQDAGITSVTMDICNRTIVTNEIPNVAGVAGGVAGGYTITLSNTPYGASTGSPWRNFSGGFWHYSTIVEIDLGTKTVTIADPLPVNVISADLCYYGPSNLGGQLDLPNWDNMELIPGEYQIWVAIGEPWPDPGPAMEVEEFSYTPRYIGIFR